ncbi:MAG: mechanosensitive ion channel family protein [Anaerolineales bacterium]|nr:mechanosensitive ion channel family protein [Chloroflexota bacterium]MBL6983738.1 mechanosensitive ion channel family protein [Anaerolineales bacterium]
MDFVFLGLTAEQWMNIGISLVIVIATAFLGRWIIKWVLDRGVARLVRKTNTSLDDALVDTVRVPLYMLAVVLAIDISLDRLNFIPGVWTSRFDDFSYILYFVIGLVFAWRFVQNFFDWYSREIAVKTETDLDEQLFPFFRRVALIILGSIAFITLLGHFDVDISAMVATLGIGSLAIALAAQSALADTISGFLIMIDRPFRIGDRIQIMDLDTWGDVLDIGLRSSRIRTRDNRMVIVPNSLIGKSLVVNYSYPNDEYRLQVHVGIAYGTDLELARETIIEAVKQVEGVLPDRKVEALFLEFGDSALIFRVRWWLDSFVDTRRMFDLVNTAVYNALNTAGIEMPYPQMDVHHKIDSSDDRQISDVLGGGA